MTDKEQPDQNLITRQVISATPGWWLISPAPDKQDDFDIAPGDFDIAPILGWLLTISSQGNVEKTAISFALESNPESFAIFAPDFKPSSYLLLSNKKQICRASSDDLRELLVEANVICTIS